MHSQVLFRGALSQLDAVILVCMAIDRYVSAMYPHLYSKHASKNVCTDYARTEFNDFTPFNL